ncbi:Lrp/AsnC family transcriptional regulator [uncultured Paracoccus sp.]|uniref:Lrp/AsnC family transcriptional regulator n=1 Tax=uncultured Paracoccus sp. TaxID=189685 RepID=UPI002626133D|nr:Lrp/AsnC family transcriptional regulator [uncultured Paracoccus sp.]
MESDPRDPVARPDRPRTDVSGPVRLDATDRKILTLLQQDTTLPLDEMASRVGASRTPVWNRIRRMREQGVIRAQVALLDPEALGLEACFFVLIRTAEHDPDWAARFLTAVRARPEVVEAHRLAGDIDYLLKVQVRNARAYDRFYQALTAEVRVQSMTALLSMEQMKSTTALPIEG